MEFAIRLYQISIDMGFSKEQSRILSIQTTYGSLMMLRENYEKT